MPKRNYEHWGLGGVNFQALRAVMANAGPDAWLKVSPKGDQLNFEVIDPGNAAVAGVGPLNDTWHCPPICK